MDVFLINKWGEEVTRYKLLFLLSGILLTIIFVNIYEWIFIRFHLNSLLPWDTTTSNVIIIFTCIMIIILAFYLAYIIIKYFKNRTFAESKYFLFLLITIAAVSIFLVIYDYRVRDLSELINFEIDELSHVSIDFEEKFITKEEGEELLNFLSQYQVKRMRDRNWIELINDPTNFEKYIVDIFTNKDDIRFLISENLFEYIDKNKRYKIVNGPADLEWFNKLYNAE